MGQFSKGDDVTWNTSQGRTSGTVVDVRTKDFTFSGQDFRASDDDPRYIVESARTGAKAAHTGGALERA